MKESYITELQTMKTTIHNKFESLHISIDERESELLFELEGIRGTIESAIRQWEQKVKDVKHTISHANTDIRDNRWSYKLLEEANEELSLLEISKPSFDVEFKLDEAIKDVLSSLGEINMERINRRTRIFVESDQTEVTGPENKFDRPTTLERFKEGFLCSIYPEEKCEPRNEFEFERKKVPIRVHPKLNKSVSCMEMSTMEVLKPEIRTKNTLRAFDDSCIVTNEIIQNRFTTGKQQQQEIQQQQQQWKHIIVNHRERKQTNKKSPKKGFGMKRFLHKPIPKRRSNTIYGATYKLSELKIHKCLAKRVSLHSRWDKTKEVIGTLRCVVTGNEKIPIVGIELQTADGTSNGSYKGIQYFKTERFKAYFLPADQVNIVM